jgi:competence protein ComGC
MKKAYSPLETLIVIFLIAIFISIFYNRYQKIETEAKLTLRDNEIRILNSYSELYKIKNGKYPENISNLFSEGYIDNNTIQMLNPYKRLKGGKYYDPFGKPYIYDKNTGKIKSD